MEYEERIDPKQGSYIVANDRSFEDILTKKTLEVEGLKVEPGEITTLHDWFFKPCMFIGFLKNAAIFYLGEGTSNLFSNGGYYYDQTFIISKKRIYKMYSSKGGRDQLLSFKKNKYTWF